MKDKLPARSCKRKKIGFDIPAHEWLRGPLRPLLQDTLEFGVSNMGTFFIRRYRTAAKQHFERSANIGYHLWGLLILFFWMKSGESNAVELQTRAMGFSSVRFLICVFLVRRGDLPWLRCFSSLADG